jgi:heptosyltransferase III
MGAIPDKPSFLIVSLRYIGDVLLSTPLALSIKTHIPDATVDFLVFKGTEGVLAKNPHVRTVHTVKPGSLSLKTVANVWRHYDFSIGGNWSDRTCLFTYFGGRHSVGFYHFKAQGWWKRMLISQCNYFDGQSHMVPLMLSQLESLKIPRIPRVVMGFDEDDARFVREQLGAKDYILLHPYSRQRYKYWPAASWARLVEIIQAQSGLRALFTRSSAAGDEAQFQQIQTAANGKVNSFPRPFTLSQLAAAIHQSRGFVGVDTVGTHMAAALDVPTVALYGPTRANCWGPWPNGWSAGEPYEPARRIQRRGNITLLQQSWPCIPCNREQCLISTRGKMECLESITPQAVFDALKATACL